MRVGLVGSPHASDGGRPLGGQGAAMAALAEALTGRDIDVTLYHCRPDAAADRRRDDADYRVVEMPMPGGADVHDDPSDADVAPMLGEFARFLDAQWSDDRPDVVYAGSWIYGVAAQLAADHHGIASVQFLPALGSVVQRRQGRQIGPVARGRFERILARSASRVLAPSTQDVDEVVRLGCSRSRASVLPDAVDTDHFTPIGQAETRHHDRRIVTVARDLLPHKGIDDVIRALPRLPGTELVIVGGPHGSRLGENRDAARLSALAVEIGVANRVIVTGTIARQHLPVILRSADVLAQPSWYEPFGLPVIEAMACGIPVVASDAGGMADTVIHDVTGMLVPARDPVRLAKALGEVLYGGALRGAMGLSGRTRVLSRYTWERVAAEAHTEFERAIGGPPITPTTGAGASSSSRRSAGL